MKKEDVPAFRLLKIGDRVLVHGTLSGVVRYVGDLDSDFTKDQIFVGVKLDDPGEYRQGGYWRVEDHLHFEGIPPSPRQ